MTDPATKRAIFMFELSDERWNWPVEGDGIRAFCELLELARIRYTVLSDHVVSVNP